jgi:hypothetical protein
MTFRLRITLDRGGEPGVTQYATRAEAIEDMEAAVIGQPLFGTGGVPAARAGEPFLAEVLDPDGNVIESKRKR